MTNTIIIDASSAPDPASAQLRTASLRSQHPAGSAAKPRLTFGGLVRAERIKLSSLRSIKFTLAGSLIAGIGLSTLIAFVWSANALGQTGAVDTPESLQEYLLISATFAAPFLSLVFGVLGVLVISSEYASGLILSTLVAAPRRNSVFLAKTLVLAVTAALVALVNSVIGLGVALIFAPEAAAELFTLRVVSGVLGGVGYLVLIALFAFGIAAMLRNAAGAIGIVAGVTFVAPIAFSMLTMSGWEWVPVVSEYVPTMLLNTLIMGIQPAAAGVEAAAGVPGYWGALGAMAVWAVVALVPAFALFGRRDAH